MMATRARHAVLERASARAREGLHGAARRLTALDMPGYEPHGRLLRPVVAYAAAQPLADDAEHGERFWLAALAVQLAHEASLLHDDVVDGAATRRGVPTLAAHRGVATALVHGDHLLTSAYRAATMAGELGFVSLFARAVERTVAGERRQAEADPRVAWREIALGKSGELFGCALATGAALGAHGDAATLFELGRRVGLVYQMLDDLLDYCPGAATGKLPLADYAAGRWTWPLAELGDVEFGRPHDEMVARLHAPDAGARSPMRRALERVESEIDLVAREAAVLVGSDTAIHPLLEEWRVSARQAVRAEERALHPAGAPGEPAVATPAPTSSEWARYLHGHGKSFHFATSVLPAEQQERIAAVYAWCRYTDDLVDRAESPEAADERLDDWLGRSRAAYDGEATGIELLDRVMRLTRESDVPFTYASELIAGMRMDLRHRQYDDLACLRLYLHRAAGTVGLWLAELHDVRDRWALERAAALGQAMQLTNIVRDVGEDWARGRLYLPLDMMRAHGVTPETIAAARAGEPLPPGWDILMEELMTVAEQGYRAGREGFAALPHAFRHAVAVASALYAGIHDAVRRNDYDTVTRRAATTAADKVRLGARALLELCSPGLRAHARAPHLHLRHAEPA